MPYMTIGCVVRVLVAVAAAWLCKQLLAWLYKLYATQRWLRTTSIPGPPASNKLTGHMSALLSDQSHLQLTQWANTYGPLYRIQLLHIPCAVLTDPAAANSLIRFSSSPDYIGKLREDYAALELATKPQLPNILTSPEDAYWKAVRQSVAPCFSISNIKQVFPWVLQLCDKAVRHVNSSSSTAAACIDVEDLAKRFTADVIGHMLFAEDLKSMDMAKSRYLDIITAVLEELYIYAFNPLRPLMYKLLWWRADVARGVAALATHDQLMGDKLQAQLDHPPPDYTITGHLFNVRDPATRQPLTFDRVKAEMAIIMAAGFETTSNALVWTMAALATHPEVQATMAAELAAAGLAPNRQQQQQQQQQCVRGLEWGDLGLPYLGAVIKESLRLFSPAALGTSRHCHKDIHVLGHKVPKGTFVMIPSYVIGLSVANFGPSADRFVPERWLEQQQLQHLDALRESAGLLPRAVAAAAAVGHNSSSSSSGSSVKLPDTLVFSSGPRDCAGQSLARLEMQAMLATLVGRFVLSPGPELQKQLAAAAAAQSTAVEANESVLGSGLNPVAVLNELSVNHVTLQTKSGIVLQFVPRF